MSYPSVPDKKELRPLWSNIVGRFPYEKDCLAAYIALETAEVLAEAKPASLLCISNLERACGRNLYTLWKKYGQELLADSPLQSCELVDRGSSLMILFSHKIRFEQHLARRDISAVLMRAGYGSNATPVEIVQKIVEQLLHGQHFPHEIGLLLGYPVKDVAAFMGLSKIPFTCQGPWKIYGNPGESLRLAEHFRHCRNLMAEQLSLCTSAIHCLGGRAGATKSLFLPAY